MQIRKILVPTDFTPNANLAVAAAAELARTLGAELALLYVEESSDYIVLDISSSQTGETNEAVMNQFEELKQTLPSDVPCTVHIEQGETHSRILATIENQDIDLVAIATHGRQGVQRFLLGSTTEKVLREAQCPGLLVQPEAALQPARALAELAKIVVSTDLSDDARRALPVAAVIASAKQAELLLVHAAEPFGYTGFGVSAERILEAQKKLSKAVETGLAQFAADVPDGVRHREIPLQGKPYEEIVRLADVEGAGLIVIATHGRTGFRKLLLGSVTERVSRTATCPVLIVPSQSH